MKTCRSCRAPIVWKLTLMGKPMPLDPEPNRAGNVRLGMIGGEEFAFVLSADDCAVEQIAGRPLYMPHWATCPDADEHRLRAS